MAAVTGTGHRALAVHELQQNCAATIFDHYQSLVFKMLPWCNNEVTSRGTRRTESIPVWFRLGSIH